MSIKYTNSINLLSLIYCENSRNKYLHQKNGVSAILVFEGSQKNKFNQKKPIFTHQCFLTPHDQQVFNSFALVLFVKNSFSKGPLETNFKNQVNITWLREIHLLTHQQSSLVSRVFIHGPERMKSSFILFYNYSRLVYLKFMVQFYLDLLHILCFLKKYPSQKSFKIQRHHQSEK